MEAMVRWARSGAMALTGVADGPPLAPPTSAALVVRRAAARFGLDERILGERAAHLGLRRRGDVSCGGATRLLATTDGWLALSLARPDDVAALPALLGLGANTVGDPWPAVRALVAHRSAAEVVEQAIALGMAAATVGGSTATVTATGAARSGALGWVAPPQVLDLSSLWAGPLCGHLLGRAGAVVTKIEASGRPDGARFGVASFFDLINQRKSSVALDLGTEGGRHALRRLVASSDVVVSSARARAFDHLGIDPDDFLAGGTDRVWVAITGHGWSVDRVGFGDDAAAAAGLVAWAHDGRPRFASDAIADPLTGAVAARLAHDAWASGGRWFLDVSLAGATRSARDASIGEAAAKVAAPGPRGLWSLEGVGVEDPVARWPDHGAAALGADTRRMLQEAGG